MIRMILSLLFTLSIVVSVQEASAANNKGDKSVKVFMPENNLHMFDRLMAGKKSNVSEAKFNQIIDEIMAFWVPIAKKHGATLTVNKNWNDSTVNAYAQQSGNNWNINMFGGLARRPEITEDGFALVVCHELGHHFAGYSYYTNDDWAANEGQSDYFATQICGRQIWKKDTVQNTKSVKLVTREAKAACDTAWTDADDQALCYRLSIGGASLAKLLAALGGAKAPSYGTPDTSEVTETNTDHPAAQCRMDTYLAGALCDKDYDLSVIPGRGNSNGQISQAAEAASFKVTCFASQGDKIGLRPSCWFKALN